MVDLSKMTLRQYLLVAWHYNFGFNFYWFVDTLSTCNNNEFLCKVYLCHFNCKFAFESIYKFGYFRFELVLSINQLFQCFVVHFSVFSSSCESSTLTKHGIVKL